MVIRRALQSISGLESLIEALPWDLFPPLWLEVWTWMRFITEERYMPVDVAAHEVYVTALSVLGALPREPMTARSMECQDSFAHFVARSWAIIVEMDDAECLLRNVGVLQICDFLRITEITNPVNLQGLVKGSGGTPVHLASLVAKLLGFFSVEDEDQFNVLQYGLNFIGRAETTCSDWRSAMLEAGVVRAVVKALCQVCDNQHFDNGFDQHGALHMAFQFMAHLTVTSPGYAWITEALNAGLLRAIVTFGLNVDRCNINPELLKAILKTISKHSVYHSVLRCIDISLIEAADFAYSEAGHRTPIFGAWLGFADIVHSRLQVKKWYDSDDYISMMACAEVSTTNDHWPIF